MGLNPARPELSAIVDFLRECSPFDALPEKLLMQAASRIEISYHAKGESLDVPGAVDGLRLIRAGAVELRGNQQQLLDLLGEGESFNLADWNEERSVIKASFVEDTLMYFLPRTEFLLIRERHRGFDRYFHSQRNRRLRRAARRQPGTGMMMLPLKQLMSKDVQSVNSTASIQQVARLMSERRISSMLVIDEGRLSGIVTDRDLRTRVVAAGLPLTVPVAKFMTPDPCGIADDATVFDAILLMTQKGYHHLPVMAGERVVGVITASDLMLTRQDDPVYLVQHISRQQSVEGMQSVVASLPNLLTEWVGAGVRADQVSRILTAISDAITQHLILLAIRKLGDPPAPFCWLGFGSQARREQLLGADQDNGLLIDDTVKTADLPWFKALAEFVCDGLNACGYSYCKGKVMATTDEWRQPLAEWCKTVEGWTKAPTPAAVMRVSIFFDLRAIYGEVSLCRQLQSVMLDCASSNSIFLAALAENALINSPPLGLFRRFLVERNGEHKHSLDLKKRGILPIVDMLRIHALANKIAVVNSRQRAAALSKKEIMTLGDSRNLQDAFDFIMQLRIENQAEQLARGEELNNYCNPDRLTELMRRQLRDVFSVIYGAQELVRLWYRAGLG